MKGFITGALTVLIVQGILVAMSIGKRIGADE